MSTNANPRARTLRLVTPTLPTINADWIAYTVMEHIDSHFPEMWKAAPLIARVNVRQAIVSAVRAAETKR